MTSPTNTSGSGFGATHGDGSGHLDDERISSWLAGADDAELELHVRACDACCARLQKDALDDVELHGLRAAIALCPACHSACNAAVDERCSHCGLAFHPGGYTVEALLASHGHSRLYRARGEDGALVAIKELSFATVPDVSALDAFDREANMLRQLRHPSIPRFISSFHEGSGVHERLYLVQELIDGTSLLDELATTRFDEARARAVVADVLAILVHLQSLSPPVIHRDVKPQNLLVRRGDVEQSGSLVLVDFGSARETAGTAGGTLVGTFGYMPPEQLTGIVDGSSDVYALAATVVHLLARRPPWEIILDGRWQKTVHASKHFIAFLEKCLAFRPHDRFHDAAAALTALRALDDKPSRRRRVATGLAIAAASLVAVGGVGGGIAAMVEAFGARHPIAASPSAPPQISDDDDGESLGPPSLSPLPPTPPVPPRPPAPYLPEVPELPPPAPNRGYSESPFPLYKTHSVRFDGSRFATKSGEVQIKSVLVTGDSGGIAIRVHMNAPLDFEKLQIADRDADLTDRVAVLYDEAGHPKSLMGSVEGDGIELYASMGAADAHDAVLVLGDGRQIPLDGHGVDHARAAHFTRLPKPSSMRGNGTATFLDEGGAVIAEPHAAEVGEPHEAPGAIFERALREAMIYAKVDGKIVKMDCDAEPCIAVARMRGTSEEFDALRAAPPLTAYAHAADVVYLFYGVDEPEHPFALAYRSRGGAVHSEIEERMRADLAGSPVTEGGSSTYR